MNEPDYLWDGAGEPDPDVERLEQALGGLAYRGALPALPPQPARERPWPSLALAAAALLVAGAALALSARAPSTPQLAGSPSPTPTARPAQAGWTVTVLSGQPVCGARPLRERGALAAGEWLETDARSRARLELPGAGADAAPLGHVEVSPASRVRLVASAPGQRRLKLQVGRLTAQVTAPPRLFQVETPFAQAIDLGCAYVLDVDAEGAARLSVTSGRVVLAWRGAPDAVVPRGATCRTYPRRGPGIPCYDDAPDALRAALAQLELVSARAGWGATDPRYAAALERALAAARPRDTLPLWHLLQRAPAPLRPGIYARLAGFAPPPAGATRAGLLDLDPAMLEAWAKDLAWDW